MSGPWTLRARRGDLSQVEIINDWEGTLTERWNLPDQLQVNGKWDDLWPLCQNYLSGSYVDRLDGGCTLSDDAGHRRFTGLVSDVDYELDTDELTVTFESDLIRLWDRTVYPDPAHAWSAQTTDYDIRTGPTETVLLGFINANAGPGALTARRVSGLVVPSSSGRGTTRTTKGRFDVLGRLVADLAMAEGLRVTVMQSGSNLNVTVTAATDRTTTAKFGSGYSGGPASLGTGAYVRFRKPDLNVAEVAGGGLGAARVLRERADAASQTVWGRRSEQTVDQNGTSVTADLDKAGDDALTSGSQPADLHGPVDDDPDLRLGIDVQLGDLVTVDLRRWVVQDRLQQITTVLSGDTGSPTVQVTGLVGSPDVGLTRTQKEFLKMKRQLRNVSNQ